jgi:hypothetical protein
MPICAPLLCRANWPFSFDVDPAHFEHKLKKTLQWRYIVRNVSLVLLVAAFIMLLPQL